MKKPEPWNTNSQQAPLMRSAKEQQKTTSSHWKTWLAIAVIGIATLMEWHVVWSVLFVYWTIQSVRNKELFFVENVKAADAPITFWATILGWLLLSTVVIVEFFMTAVAA